MNAVRDGAVSPPRGHDRVDGFASALLVALCLSWGLNHVSIKIANEGIQPIFQSGLRSALGTVLIFGWCWLRGLPLFARDGTLIAGIVAGTLFGLEFLLVYLALDYTTVSRAVIFLYLTPFMVAVGAHVFLPGERLTLVKSLGLIAAFSGVVLVFSDELSLPSPAALIGDAMSVVAAAFWAATIIVIKATALKDAAPEKVLIYQLGVSAVILLAAAPLFGPLLRDVTPLVVGALAYQVIVVVSVSYVAWFWLIRHYPAAKLSAFTFLTPIFGVMFGAMLLAEPISPRLLVALALVAFGIYLVNRPQQSRLV